MEGVTNTKRILGRKYYDEWFWPNVSHTGWALTGDDEENIQNVSMKSSHAFPHMTADDDFLFLMQFLAFTSFTMGAFPPGVFF